MKEGKLCTYVSDCHIYSLHTPLITCNHPDASYVPNLHSLVHTYVQCMAVEFYMQLHICDEAVYYRASSPGLVWARCNYCRSSLSLPLPMGVGPGRQGLGELVQEAVRTEEIEKRKINRMRCTQHNPVLRTVFCTVLTANQAKLYTYLHCNILLFLVNSE